MLGIQRRDDSDRAVVAHVSPGDAERATRERARLLFVNYPNNPTGAVVPEGFFARVVEFARAYDILVVHDNAYSEIAFDGYRAPSFLATPGAKAVKRSASSSHDSGAGSRCSRCRRATT